MKQNVQNHNCPKIAMLKSYAVNRKEIPQSKEDVCEERPNNEERRQIQFPK